MLFGYWSGAEWLWRAVPGYPAVHPITAIALALAGLAAAAGRLPALATAASVGTAGLGVLRLIDISAQTALLPAITPFSSILAHHSNAVGPLVMSLNTALGLLAIGVSQILARRRLWTASQMVGGLGIVPFAIAVIGYLYELGAFYAGVAPATVAGGLCAALATLLAGPERAILGVMLGSGAPGRLSRRLLIASTISTVLVGWPLSTRADPATRALLAAEVVIVVAVLVAIITVSAMQFDESDRRRRAQEAALRHALSALRSSERNLAEETRIFETTLEQMDQGIMMIDADRTVAVCNRNAVEMLDLPPDLMASRPNFAAVLAHQRKIGEFDGTDARMQELVRVGGLLDQPHIYERQRPNGRVIEVRSVPVAGGGVVRTYSDITARRTAEERIRYVARHDDLTRVANRAAFLERLHDALALASTSARRISVLYLDLDRFKLVNDTRGHVVGDALLARVADRIRATVRDVDTVARVGSDEFAIVQAQVEQPLHAASSLAQRLVDGLAEPYEIDGQRSVISVSIGIALFPLDGSTPDALLRNADTALYRAKADGRSTFRFFEPEMDLKRQQRSMLEQDLREAVALGHFTLAYQPVCDMATGTVVGFESLLRWTHALRGVIEPKDFVPLAEDTGLIVPLGLWALEAACAEAVTWPRKARVAVNLSPAQFRQPELAARVAEILHRTGLPPSRLDLEITEGVLLEHTDDVLDTMTALKRQGIGISLDDFGTANAGLSYLRLFPFDRVKIDRSFVQNIAEEPDTLAIVQAVLTLCRTLRLSVVAEGVETVEQLHILRDLGCQSIQGYYSGRPMSAAQVRELLASGARGWVEDPQLVGN